MNEHDRGSEAARDLLAVGVGVASTILADPPWQFSNSTGKVAPEHKRLLRYPTMTLGQIMELPVAQVATPRSHLYLWVPNALIAEGLEVMRRWGFQYKSNIVWYKVRKDGGPDRRGVGFYFRNVTEVVLFGIRGKSNRTREAGRRQPNVIVSQKREHSRKPDELYDIIESCSHGPYLELFARSVRPGWLQWGNEVGAPRMPAHRGYSDRSRLRTFADATPRVLRTARGVPALGGWERGEFSLSVG
ncbi:MAG: S-adenosylmethionine-binding protein [Planctomycetes bacterium]|nr:S-adenosylmethionine-binding protein [Planctomycetota bacterium]